MPKITQGRVKTSGLGTVYFSAEKNRPVFTTPAGLLTTAPGGVPLLFGLAGYDLGDNPLPITYTVVAGDLPPGLTLDSLSGHILGIPTNDDKTYTFTVRATDGISYIDRTFLITIENRPPVWVTPPGQVGGDIKGQHFVDLALLATDENNDALSYNVVSGTLPPGITLDAGSGALSGVAPAVDFETTFYFTVDVDDGHGGHASETFFLDVLTSALPPVWVTPAGSIGSIPMNKPVGVLGVLAKTNTKQPLTYTVIGGAMPSGLTFDPVSGLLKGTPNPVQADTTSQFTVQADDGQGNVISRDFSVTITHVNLPPIWVTQAGSLGQANGGTLYSVTLRANDPDNGPSPLTYSLAPASSLPAGLTLSGNVISGTVANQPASASFTIDVTDGLATVPLTLSLQIVYVPPIWITPAGDLGDYPMNMPLEFDLQASDRAGASLTFLLAPGGALPPGLTMSPSGVITGTPSNVTKDTTYSFTVRLDDGLGQGTLDQVFTMTITHVNRPPVWVTPAMLLGTYQMLSPQLSIPLRATDPDGDALTYTVTNGALPPGLSLNLQTGMISGVPAVNTADTLYTFTVTVNDGNGGTANQTFTIVITHVVRPPVWQTAAGLLATEPMLVPISAINLVALDPDTYPVSYSVSSGTLPPGLSLNGTSGAITGTPTAVAKDTTTMFSVTADDQQGGLAVQSFTIIVKHVNRAPVWITAGGNLGSSQMLIAITPISFSALDPDGDTVAYAVASGSTLPPGLSFNASTAVLSGTPSAVNTDTTYSFTLTASDAFGGVTPQTFAYTVTHVVRPPTWVTPTGSVGTYNMGVGFSVPLVATDPDSIAVTYSLTSGALPPGVTLGSSSGLLGGSAGPVLTDTTYPITVTASDGPGLTVQQSFSVVIKHVNRPPIWSSSGNLGTFAANGSLISAVTLTAVDPDGDKVTYALHTGSTLPAALSIVASGSSVALSGSLAANIIDTIFTFALDATDPFAAVNTATFTLLAQHYNQPPKFNAGTFPKVAAGTAYSSMISATDPDNGPSPLVYSLVTGLPQGLVMDANGVISGTPTSLVGATGSGAATVYVFQAQVTDGAAAVTGTFTLPVTNLSPTFVTPVAGGTIGYAGYNPNRFTWPVTASSPQGYALTFALVGAGSGQAVISTGSASANVFGSYGVGSVTTAFPFVVAVSDAYGGSGTRTFVAITDGGATWISAGTLGTVNPNAGFTYQLSTTSGSFPPITYALATATPGIAVSSSGLLTGTLTQAATFIVNATDNVGVYKQQTLSLSMNADLSDPFFAQTVWWNHCSNLLSSTSPDVTGRHGDMPSSGVSTPDKLGHANAALRLGNQGTNFPVTLNAGDWSFGSAPFTIEFYLNVGGTVSAGTIDYINTLGWGFYGSSSSTYTMNFGFSSVSNGAYTTVLGAGNNAALVGTWSHIAICNNGTLATIYVNGVARSSVSSTTWNVQSFGSPLYIQRGRGSDSVLTSDYDEFRVTLAARYTGNFTPPASPAP